MCAAEVRKLAAELMRFEEGLPADALEAGGAPWPFERRRWWRSLLEKATEPPQVGRCTCHRAEGNASRGYCHSADVSQGLWEFKE